MGLILGASIYAIIGVAAGVAGESVVLSFALAALIAALTGLSYAELFEGETAEITDEEGRLLDRIDSDLTRRDGSGLWGQTNTGLLSLAPSTRRSHRSFARTIPRFPEGSGARTV